MGGDARLTINNKVLMYYYRVVSTVLTVGTCHIGQITDPHLNVDILRADK